MEHSIECEELQKAWDEKYPYHCKKCNGAGGFYFSGTRWIPPDFAECEDCVEQGKCPLCGLEWDMEHYDWNDELPCGHRLDNPEAPYCICEYEPICPNDRRLMKYKETVWVDGMYEVEVFECPECRSEVRW